MVDHLLIALGSLCVWAALFLFPLIGVAFSMLGRDVVRTFQEARHG